MIHVRFSMVREASRFRQGFRNDRAIARVSENRAAAPSPATATVHFAKTCLAVLAKRHDFGGPFWYLGGELRAGARATRSRRGRCGALRSRSATACRQGFRSATGRRPWQGGCTTVSMFPKQAASATDAERKSFAGKFVPTQEQQLAATQELAHHHHQNGAVRCCAKPLANATTGPDQPRCAASTAISSRTNPPAATKAWSTTIERGSGFACH